MYGTRCKCYLRCFTSHHHRHPLLSYALASLIHATKFHCTSKGARRRSEGEIRKTQI